MNWRNIILLSLLSLPATLLSIIGVIRSPGVEMIAWLVVALGIAWMLARGARPFLSGLACGLLMGLWSHLLSMALWAQYVANNAELSAQIAEGAASKGMSVSMFLLLSAPMVGLFYGVVLGLLAWGAAKVRRPKTATETATTP